METIPSGYQLSVTTWENDADNYKTKTFPGLTKEDVKFYLHFLFHFRSHWMNEKVGEGYGNTEVSFEKEKAALGSAWKNFPPSSSDLVEDVQNSLEYWETGHTYSCDWAYELVGNWNEGGLYRVFESFKVHLFREPVPDVTEEFYNPT